MTSPSDHERLDLFAEELRRAHHEPPLTPAFRQRLLETLQPPVWTFRRALQQNRLLRAAAAALILTTASVPVLAIVALMQPERTELPPLTFELPAVPLNLDRSEAPALSPMIPVVPEPLELLDDHWLLELERENRLRSEALLQE